jgi:hypothetical protein
MDLATASELGTYVRTYVRTRVLLLERVRTREYAKTDVNRAQVHRKKRVYVQYMARTLELGRRAGPRGASCAKPADRRRPEARRHQGAPEWHHVDPRATSTWAARPPLDGQPRLPRQSRRRSTPTSPTSSLSSWRPEATSTGGPTSSWTRYAAPPTPGPRGTSGDRHPKTSRSCRPLSKLTCSLILWWRFPR